MAFYNSSEKKRDVDSTIGNWQEYGLQSLSDFVPEESNHHYDYPFANEFGSNIFQNAEPNNQGNYRNTDFSCNAVSSEWQPAENLTCLETQSNSYSLSSAPYNDYIEPVEYLNQEYVEPSSTMETITTTQDIFSTNSTLDAIQSFNVNVAELRTETVTYNESSAMVIERNLRKSESKADEKRRLMKEKQIAKHSLKEQCTCSKMCSLKVCHDRRATINKSFNGLDIIARKLYIRSQTSVPSSSRNDGGNRRTRTVIEYFLNDAQDQRIQVCQKFFLTTLGFNPNNNTVVQNALKNEFPAEEKRGKYLRDNALTESNVVDHIMNFHPEVSHHRREHSPNRLYLPSDVTIVKMHSLFNASYPEKNCSYDYYRKIVDKMNISFCKLGQEKCEDCAKYEQHKVVCTATENCNECIAHVEHKRRYDKTRIHYQADKSQSFDPKHIRVSADLQKVVMLPRMEQFKEVLFTKRLRVFNQTFAPLGSSKHIPVFPCLWHDGIAGRKKEEIISCYHAFFLKHLDAKEITIWCDNCTSQNKCWDLFSFFVYIVNSTEISADRINIKYLQKGHTFMSADSFHHQVELSMKNREDGCVYDFEDFVDAVQMSNGGRISCKELNFFNFADWPDWCSVTKVNKCEPKPYVHDFAKLKFLRGKKFMYYANDFDDDFTDLDFIMAKDMQLARPPPRTNRTGILQETKNVIIDKLTPLMPATRRHFWQNL